LKRYVRDRGDPEADEPCVVVEWAKGRNDESAPREGAADDRGENAGDVPSAVASIWHVQVLERQLLLANDPIIGDQYARD